jgi:hypothetical protein
MNEKDFGYLSKFFVSHVVSKDPSWAVSYAAAMGRNAFVESCVINYPTVAAEYARHVVKGRWEEAEHSIALSFDASVSYSKWVLKGPFPLYENTLEKYPSMAVRYARETGNRVKAAEKLIVSSSSSISVLFDYMRDVIKGRFPPAEERLKQKPVWLWKYADIILCSKLPEELHVAMSMHSFSDPSNKSVKKYFATYGK